MCLSWPVNCKLFFAAGHRTTAFLKSDSFLYESDKDEKSWQRRLVIKIHLCPIRVCVIVTEIVAMSAAGNKERIQSPKHDRLEQGTALGKN